MLSLPPVPPSDSPNPRGSLDPDLEPGLNPSHDGDLTLPPPAYSPGTVGRTDWNASDPTFPAAGEAEAPPAYAFAPRPSASSSASSASSAPITTAAAMTAATKADVRQEELVRAMLAAEGMDPNTVAYAELRRLCGIRHDDLGIEIRRMQARSRMPELTRPAPAATGEVVPVSMLDVGDDLEAGGRWRARRGRRNRGRRRANNVVAMNAQPTAAERRVTFKRRLNALRACVVGLLMFGFVMLLIVGFVHNVNEKTKTKATPTQNADATTTHDMATGYATPTPMADELVLLLEGLGLVSTTVTAAPRETPSWASVEDSDLE